MPSLQRRPHIAIVGAGIAGLRCAAVLLQRHAKVTVFEARDRVGGRLHQQRTAGNSNSNGHGYLVDMGPNWIHGTINNPIMHLAQQTKSVVVSPEADSEALVYDSDGKAKTPQESQELSAAIWALIGKAFQHSDEHSASIDPAASLYDFFKERLPGQISSHKNEHEHEHEHEQEPLRDALNECRMWGQFVGDSIEKQSLKFFFLEQCVDGENVFVASTYQSILDQIASPVLQAAPEGVVKFQTEVTKVELVETGVQITASASAEASAEASEDTSTVSVSYDEVVVTCPLGWLKQHHARVFHPPLPHRLGQAISNIGYGHLEKVYVTFATAWWLDSASTSASASPAFFTFHPPASHPLAPPNAKLTDWNQSILSLAHLPPPHNHPTLLFYIYGDCAATVVHAIADLRPGSKAYNDVLTAFAQPFYSQLPNYHSGGSRSASSSSSRCSRSPTGCLATTWSNDRYAGNGSYSNFQTGAEHADRDIEEMRNSGGLWERENGGLWLAGEHTAPFVALGTTTGAWWSGEAVARRICQKHGMAGPGQ